MSEPELRTILKSVDAALEVYRTHEGKLSAFDISVKSMLMVVRSQIAEQSARQHSRIIE